MRVAGQDTRRGTFSQRHATLVDNETESEYTPLAHIPDAQAPFMIYDSVLSEFAALGFEYGYSVADRDALVAWEAQFGDFMNGAQTIIDQFVVAAEDKWGQHSGLVLLLPHGWEGQGPEHSSRPPRTLPRDVRRGQHPRRLPDDRVAVLPRAAPAGARSRAQAARRAHAEALPPHAGDAVPGRRADARRVPPRHRRPERSGPGARPASDLLHREVRGTSCSPSATKPTHPSRSRASSSCIPGPSARSSSSCSATPTPR